jgi:hypothetical protein
MAGRGGEVTEVRRRARAAEGRAAAARARAEKIAAGVSPDRDLEGAVQQCAQDAATAASKCSDQAHKCDDKARTAAIDPYADRLERKDALQDASAHAKRAEMYADEAKLAADGAKWHAEQMEAGDREVAATTGAGWGATFRGWNRRSR